MTEIYLHIVARMHGRLIVPAPVQWLAAEETQKAGAAAKEAAAGGGEESTESKPPRDARVIPHKRNRAVIFNSKYDACGMNRPFEPMHD